MTGCKYHCHKNRWHNKTRGISKLANKRNFRNEIFMCGFIHQRTKQHQKPRHYYKYRKQREENRLNQINPHIRPNFKLHKQHSKQTADGSHTAGCNFRNRLAQCCHNCLLNWKTLMLLLITITKNNCIIQRQSQLQYRSHRIGYKGNLAHNKVGSHIQHRCHNKSQKQYRNFCVSLGGQKQHQNNNHCHIHHNHFHFPSYNIRKRIPNFRAYIYVLPCQYFLYFSQGLLASGIILVICKRNSIQCRSILIVSRSPVKGHTLNPFHL